MKKRLFSLVLAVCLVLTLIPAVSAAEVPGSFDAYMIMAELRKDYPEGTPWTNDNTYAWKGGIFDWGEGCAAFAFILSDAVFGDLPARQLTGVPARNLRPGDILRLNGDTHSVIVLQNTSMGIVIAEGNYNASVHWDRIISYAEAESADYVLTRYPENWQEPAAAEPLLDTAMIMNHFTMLRNRLPQGMYWDYNYTYYWNGGIYNGSAGSYAFAMLLSDTVFTDLPACSKQGMTLEDLRVGDIVVDSKGGAGIVTEKLGDRVRLAEGQDGGIVNWERTMNAQELSQAMMVITRYPDAQPDASEKTMEEKAYDAMAAMKDRYPEGKPWSNADAYTWKGGPNETGYGCFAFAYILSDAAFGSAPARKVTEIEMSDVRAGDILVTDGYSVIVLEAQAEYAIIAEGEYNGGIHWGRAISKMEAESADYLLTRYPADYQDPEENLTPADPTGAVLESGNCGLKGGPVQWAVTEDGTLIFSGAGKTENYNFLAVGPWNAYKDIITTVIVKDGITEMGDALCYGLENLTQVYIPESVLEIGIECFAGCTSLETVRLPQSVEKLDNRCFQNCTALKNINFPASLKTVGSDCFRCCSSLTQANLNPGVTYLGMGAFSQCDALEVAVIPGTVSNIQNTFDGCGTLKTLILCEGLEEVGREFAADCESLEQVLFPSTLKSIGDRAFRGSGIMEVTLPASLTELGESAFSSCDRLHTVNINHTVENFGTGVFAYCDSLKNLNIADGVTNIGKSTFMSCDSLEFVTLPGSLGRVEVSMFTDTWDCGPVVAVLEEGITSVAKNAFEQCTNLKEVHLPASLTLIEENAFDRNADFWEMTFYYYGTPEQWAAVEIRNGNYSLDSAAFIFAQPGQCGHAIPETLPAVEPTCQRTGLTEGQNCKLCGVVLVAQETLPALDHSYENGSCIWCGTADSRPSDSVIASGKCGDNLTWELALDGTLTVSGTGKMWDFKAEEGLVGKENALKVTGVIIEAGVTSIGEVAFWKCENMTSFSIGPDVRVIGENAFAGCSALTEILIPKAVTRIERAAFNQCVSLEKVDIRNGDIYLGSWAFTGCDSLTTVIIPQGSLTMHENNPFTQTPFLAAGMDEEGFNILGSYLLYYGGTEAEPVIPGSVKYIASEAFMNNTVIESITIPEGVTEIGSLAFSYCVNLREVVIPTGMEKIGQYAFHQEPALERITFWGDAPDIDDAAFQGTGGTAYILSGNPTWPAVNPCYGGSIIWGVIVTPVCEHSEKLVRKGLEADCVTPGIAGREICRECGHVLQNEEAIPALGHDWAGTACTRCGEVREGLPGDANGDGEVTYLDAMLVLRVAVGLTTMEDETNANVDGDGFITYLDAMQILRMAVGLA